jgi:hypothetical protein
MGYRSANFHKVRWQPAGNGGQGPFIQGISAGGRGGCRLGGGIRLWRGGEVGKSCGGQVLFRCSGFTLLPVQVKETRDFYSVTYFSQ